MAARYVVGIDLGTTNCALSYAEPGLEEPAVISFGVLQLVEAGTTEERPTLPSFYFQPTEHDFEDGALALPWAEGDAGFCVGALARDHGAKRPRRLVSSSKSWLCHGGVDRRAAILPWDTEDEPVDKLSPIAVARTFLEHLRAAWDHSELGQEAPLNAQEIYLTVPASFDAVARELTVEAAAEAGLGEVVLLEEPLAAFYAWLHSMGDAWRDELTVGDKVLVCDVGGGTTDFSLIEAKDQDGDLTLERVAVGDHILLGGDNMDLALAQVAAAKMKSKKKPDPWQSRALWYRCREAKERLLSEPELDEAKITVLGRGRKLVGNTLKTSLTREDIEKVVLEGFFPQCDKTAEPRTAPKGGLRQLGLPYAMDAAVTKHVADFLMRRGDEAEPSAILFNGGVFKGALLRERLHEIVGSWCAEAPRLLAGTDLDLAVATGAACYGLARRGDGIRVRGGAPRSYYIGVESAMPAVPGFDPPIRALCVVPYGMEAGTAEDVPERKFGLVVGEPVEFRFFSSLDRREDVIGELIEDDDLLETAPIQATLEAEGKEPGETVAVTLRAEVTEVGTLDLRCVAVEGDQDWKLSFDIRDGDDDGDGDEAG